MFLTDLRTLALTGVLALGAAPLAAAQCVDFDPPTGTGPWGCCGVTFGNDGVGFRTTPFQWPTGAMFAGGSAGEVPDCAGGPGASLWTNNVNVDIRLQDYFGVPEIEYFNFHYEDFGGNINLRVNGLLANFDNYHQIPAGFFNPVGATHTVTAAWTGVSWVGDVLITAMPGHCIDAVETGGQELCLDDFCADNPCLGCPGDIDGDGVVGFGDVLSILSAWGPCGGCPQDLDGNGNVGFADLLFVLSAWGPC